MMRGGVELLPKQMGGHVGITIYEKPPTLAALAMAVAKRQEVAALCHLVQPVPTWVHQRVLFLSKNIAKQYKRHEDC